MKRFLFPLLLASLLFISCGQNEPIKYDNVSGHSYAAKTAYCDTLHFNTDGTYTINSMSFSRSYRQDERILMLEQYSEGYTKLLEAMDGKLVDWKTREGLVYYRIR